MENTQEKTIVVFRKWKNGDIIALFPAVPSDYAGRYCESYEHVGQHGGADYTGVVQQTKPALWGEYQELRRELECIGYVLDVRQRASSTMFLNRLVESQKIYKHVSQPARGATS